MEKNLSLQELQPLLLQWANEKSLLKPENAPAQRLKLLEEVGETAGASLKNKPGEVKDGLGDIFVVVVILAEQVGQKLNFGVYTSNPLFKNYLFAEIVKVCFTNQTFKMVNVLGLLNDLADVLGFDLTECANLAWNEIKDRTGKTVNGTFIKN